MPKVNPKAAEKGQKAARPAAAASAKATADAAMASAKAQSEKCLAKVPEEFVFWCHDGQVFRSLVELAYGFDLMSDETYCYHANEARNDFSTWIVDIVEDPALAEKIKKAKTRQEAKEITRQRYYDLTRLEG